MSPFFIMKVKMKASMSGVDFSVRPREIYDGDEAEMKRWIDAGLAEPYVDVDAEAKVKADAEAKVKAEKAKKTKGK